MRPRMLAEFTRGERSFALALATIVSLAGLFYAFAGQDALIQTHGAMAAVVAALALLYLVVTYSAPEPAPDRLQR